ncbi:MAG: caspase family protein [Gammaproteobacteria bacterium]
MQMDLNGQTTAAARHIRRAVANGLFSLLAMSCACTALAGIGSGAQSTDPAAFPGVYQLYAPEAMRRTGGENAGPGDRAHAGDQEQVAAQMRVIEGLRDAGLIPDPEFQRRRQSLLSKAARPVRDAASTVQAPPIAPALFRGVEFGNFHALVVGNNGYENFPRLETAVTDALAVADLLRDQYGFNVTTLFDTSRYALARALSQLRTSLSEDDNLLIYYAGHGYMDETTGRGYWLPVDAETHNTANWISTADVTDALHGMSARHVMVVADSCYSGTLTRAGRAELNGRAALIERLAGKRSRTVLASGGLEPVLDSGGGDHSVFADALLRVLAENRGVMEGSRLFTELRRRVVLEADQTPEYADIRKAGHQGGDFIFVRRM